jgi:hypothetical protein
LDFTAGHAGEKSYASLMIKSLIGKGDGARCVDKKKRLIFIKGRKKEYEN